MIVYTSREDGYWIHKNYINWRPIQCLYLELCSWKKVWTKKFLFCNLKVMQVALALKQLSKMDEVSL